MSAIFGMILLVAGGYLLAEAVRSGNMTIMIVGVIMIVFGIILSWTGFRRIGREAMQELKDEIKNDLDRK